MQNFDYVRAQSWEEAVAAKQGNAKFIGGGTSLVDLMREKIEKPDSLIDVSRLDATIEELANGTIRIGAAAKNTDIANHRAIRERYPFLSQAILTGASGQIRNMATAAGNVMQRTRCFYFYDDAARCNKREPGTGCDALEGHNRIHAILGASEQCIATHPSDMCVALAALDAQLELSTGKDSTTISINDFIVLPGETPQIENTLGADRIITAILIPPQDFAKQSAYRKVRDRASYAFSLVSAAVAVQVESDKISTVRIALGGVAHKPWRAEKAEAYLIGKEATPENFRAAAEAEMAEAKGYKDNAFKIELAKRLIVETLEELLQTGGAA